MRTGKDAGYKPNCASGVGGNFVFAGTKARARRDHFDPSEISTLALRHICFHRIRLVFNAKADFVLWVRVQTSQQLSISGNRNHDWSIYPIWTALSTRTYVGCSRQMTPT